MDKNTLLRKKGTAMLKAKDIMTKNALTVMAAKTKTQTVFMRSRNCRFT